MEEKDNIGQPDLSEGENSDVQIEETIEKMEQSPSQEQEAQSVQQAQHRTPPPEKKKKGGKIALIVILIVLAIAGCGFGYFAYQKQQEEAELMALLNSDVIYPGVSIAGYSVGGMSRDAAASFLEDQLKTLGHTVRLVHETDAWEFSFAELGVAYNTAEAVEAAYAIGRTGEPAERKAVIMALEETPRDITLDVSYDAEAVKAAIGTLAEEVNREPEDAFLVKEGETFVVEGGAAGQAVVENATVAEIVTALRNFDTQSVPLHVETWEPALNKAVFDFPISLIGSFSTAYSLGDIGRNTNLEVGCENITGTVLMPGETFSMNEGLGDQTWENGYRNAAVIMDGKLEQGLGGGVCQITTTVYNAVIRAELEVVERHNHSLAVGYIASGLDAAVAGTYKDLKFRNSTEYPIYLEASAVDGTLSANIYGFEEHDPGRRVDFERVYVGTIPKPAEKVTLDPERYEDEREVTYNGKNGFKMTVYKVVYENDVEVSREWFSDSTYRAVADEVTVGTKVREDAPIGSDPSAPASTQPSAPQPPEQEPDAETPLLPPETQTPEETPAPETPPEETPEDIPIGAEENDDNSIPVE